MSRRITVLALAASATLIATQASADRECFEDSCRNFEIAEPTSSAVPPPVADGSVAAEPSAAVVAPAAAEASAAADANAAAVKLTPAKALPQVVETPQVAPVKAIATPAPRPPVQSYADQNPARLAPRVLKPAPVPAPVRVTNAVPEGDIRAERIASTALPPPPASYRARRDVSAPIIGGLGYADDNVVRVYPNSQHDQAWTVCQFGCGAYSYRPLGPNGYRPYGTYAAERAAPVYMIAPSAKIIAVDDY